VNEISKDPERLAALLDGRLEEREREALLAALNRSPDELEALGDLSEVMRDLESAGDVPGVPDVRPTVPVGAAGGFRPSPGAASPPAPAPAPRRVVPRRQLRWAGGLAAAAALLLVVNVLYDRNVGGRTAFAADAPADVLAVLADASIGAGDAQPVPAWPTTRGSEAATERRARAIRFGARAIDLEVATQTGDASTAARLAGQMADALSEVAGAGPAPIPYRRVMASPGAPRDSLAAWLREGWEGGAVVLGADDARLGAWLATARIAAARRDTSFLRNAAWRRALEASRALVPSANVEARAAAARLGDLARTDGGGAAPDWDRVRQDVESLLVTLGS
jgi:hypothetical protein